MRFAPFVILSVAALLLPGCGGSEPASAVDTPPPTAAANQAAAIPTTTPPPPGDPPADVVRALVFEDYEELADAGPMPATVTASGRQLQLRAKLFEARKKECRPLPQQDPGKFECSLTIKLALTGDGSDPALEEPSEQGDRIFIEWDSTQGKWIRSATRQRR